MPDGSQWHKITEEELDRNESRVMVALFYNTPCISCGACNQGMTKVGPFVICHNCYQKEFAGKVDCDDCDRCYISQNDTTYIKLVEKNKKEMAK